MSIAPKLATRIAKLSRGRSVPLTTSKRAAKLRKHIGLTRQLSNKVQKRRGQNALQFAQKVRKFRKSKSCPPVGDCSPSPPERTVLVISESEFILDCVEHSFPEICQSCTRSGLMQALGDDDPACDDSDYSSESEPELVCSPPPPNVVPAAGARQSHTTSGEKS